MKATLPYPPSANRYWRTFRNRTVVSDEARRYKALVKVELAKWPLLSGPVALIAHLYRPQKSGDLDNRLKVLGDALNGVAWADDSQVVEIHAYRHDDKARPRVEVEVRALGVEGVLESLEAPICTCGHGRQHHVQGTGRCIRLSQEYCPCEHFALPKGHLVTPAYQREQTEAVVPKRRKR